MWIAVDIIKPQACHGAPASPRPRQPRSDCERDEVHVFKSHGQSPDKTQ